MRVVHEPSFAQIDELSEKTDVLAMKERVKKPTAVKGASGFAQPGDPA